MAISVFTSGAFLYTVAKIVERSTGFSFQYVVIFLTSVIVPYTARGGFWAVIVADVLQFVLLASAVIAVVPLTSDKIGVVNALFEKMPSDFFPKDKRYNPAFLYWIRGIQPLFDCRELGLCTVLHERENVWMPVKRPF